MLSNFSNLHYFWQMGGYGYFVWPAYLTMILIFGSHIIIANKHLRNLRKKIFKKHVNPS